MRLSPLLALAALTACVPPEAVDAPPPQPALKSQVVFYDYRTPADPKGEFMIRFDDGSGEREVPPSDLRLREFGFPSSATYDTRSSGTLHIEVDFDGGAGRTASGAVDLPLKPDWIHGIALHVTSRSPLEGCMGCMGVRSFPLAGAAGGAQLHIVWGGNSISRPVAY